MTTLTHALGDSATMVARQLRHMRRYPSMTLLLMGMPIVFLLLFVYVFGGAMGAEGASVNRADYADYIAPGILLITVASAAQGTAISVAMDMTEGIVARFRTMAIARVSVLTGHVVGSVIQAMLAVAVVTGVAVLIGFRPSADPADGRLDVCLVRRIGLARFLLAIPRVMLGTHAGMKEVALFQTRALVIRSPDAPLLLHLDGELREPGTRECRVTLAPGALNVLVAE